MRFDYKIYSALKHTHAIECFYAKIKKIFIQYVIKRLMKGPTVKISVQSIDEYDTV